MRKGLTKPIPEPNDPKDRELIQFKRELAFAKKIIICLIGMMIAKKVISTIPSELRRGIGTIAAAMEEEFEDVATFLSPLFKELFDEIHGRTFEKAKRRGRQKSSLKG